MSEQVNVSVNIDPDEIKAWAENHINGIPASVAHVLFAAHDLYAGMQEEWGVEDVFGDIVWFIPGDYVDASEEEVKEWAKEYAESDTDFRLVRRYVTGVIDGED